MQEAAIPETLSLRSYKSNAVYALIIWIGFLCYIASNWNKPDGTNSIISLIFIIGGILAIISIFDKAPRVIIEQEGIWKRKSRLPFSPLILVNWNEMQYFYLLRQESEEYSNSYYLVIRNSWTEKDVKIELTALDSSLETIFSLVRQYAEKYGIHDLGEEVK